MSVPSTGRGAVGGHPPGVVLLVCDGLRALEGERSSGGEHRRAGQHADQQRHDERPQDAGKQRAALRMPHVSGQSLLEANSGRSQPGPGSGRTRVLATRFVGIGCPAGRQSEGGGASLPRVVLGTNGLSLRVSHGGNGSHPGGIDPLHDFRTAVRPAAPVPSPLPMPSLSYACTAIQ